MNKWIKSFIFLLFALTTQWVQAQSVAKVGTTEYATLQAAVNAAQDLGGTQTINLISNISGETVTINEVANFKLTIDGQKDASSNYTVDAVIVVDGLRGSTTLSGSPTNGATVTLQNIAFVDGGYITSQTSKKMVINPCHYPHHLTIQDCTYTGKSTSLNYWFMQVTDGPLYGANVKNVTVEHSRLISANLALDAVFESIIATNDITAGFNDIRTSGTVLIKNCQVTTAKYAFRDNPAEYVGTITLQDNTFISTSTTGDEGVIVNRGGSDGTAKINIESGTYLGQVKVNKQNVLNIYAGTKWSYFVNNYLADDIKATHIFDYDLITYTPTNLELGNVTYTVREANPVAEVVEKRYQQNTLQGALLIAEEGETVKLLKDVSYGLVDGTTNPTYIFKKVTLDGNGKTLTNEWATGLNITGPGPVTINNLTINSLKSRGIQTGYVYHLNNDVKYEGNLTGTLTINNCTIKSGSLQTKDGPCRYFGVQIVSPNVTVNLYNSTVLSDVDNPTENYTTGGGEHTGVNLSDDNITVNLTNCEIQGFRNCFGCGTYTSPKNNVVNMTGGKTYGLYVFSHPKDDNTNAQYLTYNFKNVDIQSQYLLEEYGRLKERNKVYLTGATTLPASGKVIDDEGKLCEGMIMMDETVAALYDGKFDNYKVVETTEEPGYTIALKGGNLLVFHDSGTYEKAFEVPMYTRMAGADIYYKVNSGEAQKYTGPLSIEADTELEAWLQFGSTKIGESITKSYTIQARPTYNINKDGYFYVKNGDKYVNVAGRKTVTLVDESTAQTAAGTVIRLVTANDTVKTLRSQAVDLPGYAKRAMNYVPEMVQLIVSKLQADGSGNILGENGYDAIMTKFNESFDYNLYLEEAGDGYRIYGRTPSMKPVVDFYAENKDQVDAKLPQLESFINSAIEKLKAKLNGRGNGVLQEFNVHTIWQKMGGTFTEPVDAESTACFYEEVLASEANVWSFAYETAMMYYEPLINKFDELSSSAEYQELFNQIGDYSKYLQKLPQVRPNFKYYIVADGSKVDFISEGNPNIDENSAIWTLEERPGFNVEFDAANKLMDGLGTKYYTTLYTDFAYTMPEDGNTKAYAVTGVIDVNDKGYAKLAEIEGVIPAQTPVLLMTLTQPQEGQQKVMVAVNLSTEAGTEPTGNLLKGNDWVITNQDYDKEDLTTPVLKGLFDILKEKMGESFYNNYLADFEHLLLLNAGTVNNKYFFGMNKESIEYVDNVRKLAKQNNVLGFWEDYDTGLAANKAFIIDSHDPVYLPLWPDVNRDGQVDVNDIIAVVDISLYNDAEERFPYYDFDVADVNGDGAINISDVIAITDIVLSIH